jgi:hypothetical protein
MPIETLEQELKNPRLQAALASAWWSEEEAELILSALERSGLTVREFAKWTQVGAARLYARRQQQRKKNAQRKALDVAARRKESEPKQASKPARCSATDRAAAAVCAADSSAGVREIREPTAARADTCVFTVATPSGHTALQHAAPGAQSSLLPPCS